MDIKYACPQCGQHFTVSSEHGGMAFACPTCAAPIAIPEIAIPLAEPIPEEPQNTAGIKAKRLALISLIVSVTGFAFLIWDQGIPWIICGIVGVVIGHIALRRFRLSLGTFSGRRLALAGVIVGYIPIAFSVMIGGLVVVAACFALFAGVSASSPKAKNQNAKSSNVRVEQILADYLRKTLEDNKQKLFDEVHPVGTANSVTLHDVTITAWKQGKDTNRLEDVKEFSIRYTLYWSGPVTKDGYTKITETYDEESQRYTSAHILATNGITNKDAEGAAGSLFSTWLQYEAQKAGTERATRDYYNQQ